MSRDRRVRHARSRHAGRDTDLLGVHPGEVAHRQQPAVGGSEPDEGRAQVESIGGRDRVLAEDLVLRGLSDLPDATTAAGAKVLACLVGRDRDQPRPQPSRLADAGQSLPRLDPRHLGGIAGGFEVARDGIGAAHQLGVVAVDERFERLALAGGREIGIRLQTKTC